MAASASNRQPEWDILLSAAQKNQPDRIRDMVLKDGVNPSHANVVGQSALHIACLWGHVEAVEALLDVGADYAAKNQLTGASPLHMAAQSNKASLENLARVVELLVAKGADRNQPDNNGMIPLDFLQNDKLGTILYERLRPRPPQAFALIDDRQVDALLELLSSDTGAASAASAVKFGGHSLLPYAVNKFLQEIEEGTTSSASLEQQVKVIRRLIETGGKTNGDSESDPFESPLYKTLLSLRDALKIEEEYPAASSDCLMQVVMLLVDGGAEVNAEIGQLLHQAARRNELHFARFLIEQMKINPNLSGRQGMTPLQFAARSGQMKVLEYLLSLPNINLLAQDDMGQTALEAARVNEKENAVTALDAALKKRHPI